MGEALNRSAPKVQQPGADQWTGHSRRSDRGVLDWRKRISDHVAFGLLVYTGLQIVLLALALKGGHSSILPYFSLVVLVAAVIPGCRLFEARWTELPDESAADPALAGAFGRDRALIWLAAVGLPFVMTGFFKLVQTLFA